MTLHEIEETVQTLTSRHRGLDEAMLVTLLRAGGWEEKDIEEAKLLWRSHARASLVKSVDHQSQQAILPPTIDIEHLLVAHNEPETVAAPESLVAPPSKEADREALPHNLPLRPFETSEHIWPFSRYRDVFYGEEEIKKPIEQSESQDSVHIELRDETPPELEKTERPLREIVQEKKIERVVEKSVPEIPPVADASSVKLSGGDEKLVVTACVMLILILLLLGYMYSNGRL